MVKEQYNKVTNARTAGNSNELHQAKFVFLGTVTTSAADSNTPTVVSAGLFYPRWCSKDGAEMPHMYVELLCCNSPGRGYGSVLLSHIEQFTAAGADYLSAAFTSCSINGVVGVMPPVQPGSVGGGDTELVAAAAAAAPGGSASGPAAVFMPVVLPLLAEGVAVPADPLSGCCTACGNAADGSASTMSSDSMQVVAGAELSCATSAVSAAAGAPPCIHQHQVCQVQPQLVPVALLGKAPPAPAAAPATTIRAAAPVAAAEEAVPAAKRIRGVKLLSVESARSFYERHGYGQPDVCREMFKPLLLLPARGVAGSASTSSICSMMSVSSSSSNAVC
jgi:hypothetical protein